MKNTRRNTKTSTLKVTLLNKTERIRRIVTAITVVPRKPETLLVSIVDNLLFLHRKRFLSQATPCVPHCENQNHYCHPYYHTNLVTLKLDTHSSVQTLIDFTRTLLPFRFVIASMRSMVFECLDNFLCFSLSSRTSPLWKHLVLF